MSQTIKEETLLSLLKLPEPILPIYEDVQAPLYSRVRDSLLFLNTRGNPRLALQIDSPGGGVGIGLDVFDLLMAYPGGVDGTVVSSAASMGAVILQACKHRRCFRHAEILIHHISRSSTSLDDLTSSRRLRKVVEGLRKKQDRLYAILSRRTGKPVSEIRRVCRKDEHMTAEEALEFGLIDEIVDGELK